jgi:hypothetical protein
MNASGGTLKASGGSSASTVLARELAEFITDGEFNIFGAMVNEAMVSEAMVNEAMVSLSMMKP